MIKSKKQLKSILYILIFGLSLQIQAQNSNKKNCIDKYTTVPIKNSENRISSSTGNSDIHQLWDELLKKHVSEDGKVNYYGFKKDKKELNIYIDSLTTQSEVENFNENEKLAFWINAYNALTVDLILKNYPLKSIKDIKKPWDQRLWKFGDKWFNLNDIEHKILRKMNEPRIHFAIVCASISCPNLLNEAFIAENLEEQLNKVTKSFLEDKTKNVITQKKLQLSKIFKWFAKDFKVDGSLIDFLNLYSTLEISDKAKINYLDYDWGLNESQ